MGAGEQAGGYVGCFADVLALDSDEDRQLALERIGRPEELATRAVAQAADQWSEVQESLAATIAAATSEKDAAKRIDSWARSIARREDLAEAIHATSLQADLAGQLFVRTVELPEVDSLRINDDRPVPSFLRMTFEEALQLFLERRVITPEEFQALNAAQREQAFTAVRLASDALRQRAHELLRGAIADGSTLRDFATSLRNEEASLGVTPSDPSYLETVFRTNLASAYNAGRVRQITSDVVRAARPFVQFRATGDTRTTHVCRNLNGKVFSQDDPAWNRYAPPLHFNCRSVIVALRNPPTGVEVSSAADLPFEPDPRFKS